MLLEPIIRFQKINLKKLNSIGCPKKVLFSPSKVLSKEYFFLGHPVVIIAL